MHLYTNLVLNGKQSNIVNCFEMTGFNLLNFNLHNILCIFLGIHIIFGIVGIIMRFSHLKIILVSLNYLSLCL